MLISAAAGKKSRDNLSPQPLRRGRQDPAKDEDCRRMEIRNHSNSPPSSGSCEVAWPRARGQRRPRSHRRDKRAAGRRCRSRRGHEAPGSLPNHMEHRIEKPVDEVDRASRIAERTNQRMTSFTFAEVSNTRTRPSSSNATNPSRSSAKAGNDGMTVGVVHFDVGSCLSLRDSVWGERQACKFVQKSGETEKDEAGGGGARERITQALGASAMPSIRSSSAGSSKRP